MRRNNSFDEIDVLCFQVLRYLLKLACYAAGASSINTNNSSELPF